LGDLNAGSGWLGIAKMAGIDIVHVREISHILQVNGCLDHIGHIGAGCRQNGSQIPEHLFCRRAGVVIHELAALWVDRNLTGAEEKVSGLDCLRIGAYRRWGCIRFYRPVLIMHGVSPVTGQKVLPIQPLGLFPTYDLS